VISKAYYFLKEGITSYEIDEYILGAGIKKCTVYKTRDVCPLSRQQTERCQNVDCGDVSSSVCVVSMTDARSGFGKALARV
jgi:hypothetical protein